MKKTYLYAIVVILIIAIVLVGLSYFSPIGNMICGRCGCFVYQCDKPPSSWGFSMTLSPTTGIATPGTPFSQTVQITITTTSGTPQPVSFSYTLSQIGLIVTQAAPCTPSSTSPYHCTSTFTVSTGAATSSGTYQVTVIGTSPGASRVSAAYNLTVMFSDGFENGWVYWNWNFIDGGSVPATGTGPHGSSGTTWTLDSSVVHNGVYSTKFTLPAVEGAWANVYKTLDSDPYSGTFPQLSDIRYYTKLYSSGWVKYSGAIPSGSYLMLGPCLCGWNDYDLVAAYIYNDSGTMRWDLEYDSNFVDIIPNLLGSTPSITPNTWYNIQVMVSIGHGTGEATMWVMKQGESQFTKVGDVTGIINDNVAVGATGQIGAGATNVQIGPFEPPTSKISTQKSFAVTTWHDDTITSTTFINS